MNCSDCDKPLAPNPRRKGTRCRRCNTIALNKSNAQQERIAAGMRRLMADPSVRSARAEACSRALRAKAAADPAWAESRRELGRRVGAKNLETTRGAESRAKAGRAISERKLAHIPRHLRDEYRKLVRSKLLPAKEAERVVIQSAQDEARREMARITADMHAKEARRVRDAY